MYVCMYMYIYMTQYIYIYTNIYMYICIQVVSSCTTYSDPTFQGSSLQLPERKMPPESSEARCISSSRKVSSINGIIMG